MQEQEKTRGLFIVDKPTYISHLKNSKDRFIPRLLQHHPHTFASNFEKIMNKYKFYKTWIILDIF